MFVHHSLFLLEYRKNKKCSLFLMCDSAQLNSVVNMENDGSKSIARIDRTTKVVNILQLIMRCKSRNCQLIFISKKKTVLMFGCKNLFSSFINNSSYLQRIFKCHKWMFDFSTHYLITTCNCFITKTD
jgi:hypothetical protein